MCIVYIIIIIVFIEICLVNGFVRVLSLFKLMIVRVNEEEVENVVWNGYKIL